MIALFNDGGQPELLNGAERDIGFSGAIVVSVSIERNLIEMGVEVFKDVFGEFPDHLKSK